MDKIVAKAPRCWKLAYNDNIIRDDGRGEFKHYLDAKHCTEVLNEFNSGRGKWQVVPSYDLGEF